MRTGSRSWRSEPRLLAIVVLAGIGARAVWAAYAARTPAGLHDPGLYRFLADSLAEGRGYAYPDGPTAYYPVGYPAVLAVLVWLGRATHLTRDETLLPVLLNLVSTGVALVALHRLGRALGLGARAALLAVGITAAMPSLVLGSAVALSEPLFLALLLPALVLLVPQGATTGRWTPVTRLLVAGALLGGATLVRPVVLPLLLVLPLGWRLDGASWRRALTRAAAVAGVSLAVVLPWMVRNAVVMDSFTLSTNTGDNACMSRQPGATGGFVLSEHCHGAAADLARPESEVVRDAAGRRLAVDFVLDDPLAELRLWPARLGATLRADDESLRAVESYGDDPFLAGGTRDVLRRLSDWSFFALLAAAALGLGVAVRRRVPTWRWPSLCLLAVVVAPVVAFFGDPRFHAPGIPFLALLAAGAFRGGPLDPAGSEVRSASATG